LHTGFIDEHLAELSPEPCPPAEAVAAAVAALHLRRPARAGVRLVASDPWGTLGAWRLG
jgi:hypothetical protein